ncbi:MAG: PIG-L family deacetylase, partial [SAR202 cluster bacterium]|nr:PIG-L family deacetylase [SAR202 cluster bacterium]
GYPDGYLEPTLDLRRDIARQIRIHKPDVLICLNPMRDLNVFYGVGHPDHIASGEAALSACFPAARDHLTFPELFTDEGLEPHKTAEAWIVGNNEPDFFVDVTNHIDTAVKALLEHKSQVGDWKPEELDARMKEWRRESAIGKGMMYAEAFKRIRFRM